MGTLILREGEALLVRRGAEPNRGRWSLPGGLVNLGETVREAAAREAHEETGVDVEPLRVFDVVDAIIPRTGRPRYHYVLTVVLARAKGGAPKAASDASDARWVPFGELPSLDLTETARAVLTRALEEKAWR